LVILDVPIREFIKHPGNGEATKPRHLRDLEELREILKDSVKKPEVLAWLRSPNDAFGGKLPVDLLIDGRARDIIVEFRRLQAGEPV